MAVKVAINEDGSIKSLLISDDQFKETLALAPAQGGVRRAQFVGKVAPLTVRKADEEKLLPPLTLLPAPRLPARRWGRDERGAGDAAAPLAEEPVEDDMKSCAVKQGFEGPVAVKVAVNEMATSSLWWLATTSSETPGLGARAQEQVRRPVCGQGGASYHPQGGWEASSTIDALTGATVTSQAVVDAVDEALTDATAPLRKNPWKMTWLLVGQEHPEGPVAVNVTVKEDGSITGLVIGDDQFKETPGLGARAQEPGFILRPVRWQSTAAFHPQGG